MTNTASSELLTHKQIMSQRDGVTRLWVTMPGAHAKLVCDGVSFARIDEQDDETVRCKLHGITRVVRTWDEAWSWMQRILASHLAYPIAA